MSAVRYGSGHINDTFLVSSKKEDETEGRVILQRMNKNIFKNPEDLIENIFGGYIIPSQKNIETAEILNVKH